MKMNLSQIVISGIVFTISLCALCAYVYLFLLIVKALRRYIRSKDVREEKAVVRQELGEALKAYREQCKMTQEFVAESIGVSRQAVSKWETGVSHSYRY